jgi:hypothetical protein
MSRAKTTNRTRWNRDELLIVLNLYHKLRFGQFDQRQPAIIDLSKKMGRTPSSVAMKLSNLASLDPVLQLRGIKGLKGASNLDRAVWEEYHTNAVELVPQGQQLFESLFEEENGDAVEVIPGKGIYRTKRAPEGETEKTVMTKQRRGQQYFREIVLNNYDGHCAVTNLPIRELLIASHILPWSGHENERLNIRNGICLNRLHDAAFDQGLIAFDDQMCLLLSSRLHQALPSASVVTSFAAYEGQTLSIPTDGIQPDLAFLAKHRKKFGFKK